MKLYQCEYLGFATADKRLSGAMMPWIIAEIRRAPKQKQICIGVRDGCMIGQAGRTRRLPDDNSAALFCHPLSQISRFTMPNPTSFFYIVRDATEPLFYCHLFETSNPDDVIELFATMKEQANRAAVTGRTQSNASTLTSLCADISPSSSHFFEVLYIGKIKVSHKKVPNSFIDDALDKFRAHEQEKRQAQATKLTAGENSACAKGDGPAAIIITVAADERRGSQDSDTGSVECVVIPATPAMTVVTTSSEEAPVFGSMEALKNEASQQEEQLEPMRARSGSVGSALVKKPENLSAELANTVSTNEHNRTMVFQVGRSDLRLISPDRKQILLHKHLKDITCCIQGKKHAAHFGFICREANAESSYIGYVFKCQSSSFSDDVVGAISQAYVTTCDAAKKEKQTILSCDHCPMVWYHKLCADIEGVSEKRVHTTIFRRLEALSEEEQAVVLTKVRGAETLTGAALKEQNEMLMMLLRAHCESKQARHVHDTAENRHEFLNLYLGGSSTIFMKAKRSLTSSFQLLKRKGSRDDLGPTLKELSLPMNVALCKESTPSSSGGTSPISLDTPPRPRSYTIGSTSSTNYTEESDSGSDNKQSSMMDIFLKVGNSPKSNHSSDDASDSDSGKQPESWRQAIFNTVVTPSKVKDLPSQASRARRGKAELRNLWRTAINQQVLLIRMEKENARLRARQEEATMKRIKLEYDEIGAAVRENMEVWDMITSKDGRVCDNKMLLQAIKLGVPRAKRGELWLHLAEQYCSRMPPFDHSRFPNYNISYDDLLRQLTSHQHAILIDLGRTFPSHTYFASPLGPGQLALFNLLKAYSLLDPEVGYCQGLSFVAGVLLLHMSEEQAFFLLRHVMFRRGLRSQYLPDMAGLQVQLYQLSRALHDIHPDLYKHFDQHEVAPTLYAAPWLLTLFASQFPLGFVTHVFDLLFVESSEVLFRISLALLGEHKEGLLSCASCEQLMEYLKHRVPVIDRTIMERIMKEAFNTDISKQLAVYEVEYHMLQEKISTPRPEIKKLKQMEATNKALLAHNRGLSEQLEIASGNIRRLETTRGEHMSQLNRLESQVRSLEVTVSTLGSFVSTLAYNSTELEIPGEILRIVAQLNLSERRKSVTQMQRKGVPLKVIDSNEEVRPTPTLKSALSSPNLSGKVASFFANSHNHIKQQKLGLIASDTITEGSVLKKSLSDTSEEMKLINSDKQLTNLHIPDGSDIPARLGRVLTEEDRKKLRLADDLDSYGKSNSMPAGDGKRRMLKTSQSSFELGKSGSLAAMGQSVHPLDSCSEVSISFGGTTKLKSIRPVKSRTESSGSLSSPSSSSGTLFDRADSKDSLPTATELKIVESSDLINAGRRRHSGNNTPNFFGKENPADALFSVKSPLVNSTLCQTEFGKAKSNETEMLIESQVSATKTGLLT